MNLKNFNETILPIIELIISIIGLSGIFLLWWQIRETTKWNKIKSNHLVTTKDEDEAESELFLNAKNIGINLKLRKKPLTKKEVNSIINDDNTYFSIAKLLMYVENNCFAINTGIVDFKLAYQAYSPRIIWIYKVFHPYIKEIKNKYKDDLIYCELEKCAIRFIEIKNDTKQ